MKKEDYISAEVLSAELHASAGKVRALRLTDPEFQVALDLIIASVIRDPSGYISHIARITTAFDHAVERKAERDWEERAAA
jgi:hypothetical protein